MSEVPLARALPWLCRSILGFVLSSTYYDVVRFNFDQFYERCNATSLCLQCLLFLRLRFLDT